MKILVWFGLLEIVFNNFLIRCEALGGRPQPQLTWWRDHALLDDSYVTIGAGGNYS